MELTIEGFKAQFKSVYGEKVWKDFCEFKQSKGYECREIDSIEEKLSAYANHIDCKTNFYKKRPNFTRFILLTLEKYNGPDSSQDIDFTNAQDWHLEHILPQSNGKNHTLGNLTLISKKLNTENNYGNKEFVEKQREMEGSIEYNFYINEIFRKDIDSIEQAIQVRDEELREAFKDIFNDINQYCEQVLKLPVS